MVFSRALDYARQEDLILRVPVLWALLESERPGMKAKKFRKRLQKAYNHTKKQIKRLRQIDALRELSKAEQIKADLEYRAEINGITLH